MNQFEKLDHSDLLGMIETWLEDEDYPVFKPRKSDCLYLVVAPGASAIKIYTVEDSVFLDLIDNRTEGIWRAARFDIRYPSSISSIQSTINTWLEVS